MSLRASASFVSIALVGVIAASGAAALDQDSLRLRKLPPDVELSWTDPTPTITCILRDPAGFPATILGQSAGLTYLDVAPPSVLVLYYQVDEPASGACGVVPPACTPVGVIACGGNVSGANTDAGSTDLVDAYACGVADATGPEIAYTYTALATGSVTASLSGLSANLDVFVIEERGNGCDPADCIAGGGDSIGWAAVAGTIYHIVVDGRAGATSSFTLSLTCPPPPPPTCSSAGTVGCGAPVSSRNDAAGSADLVDSWGGCGGRDASGPEIVNTFVATAAGSTTATLSGAPAGLDVYVLADLGAGCDPASCVAFGDTVGTFNAVAGGTYYVVVDGFSGATGAFTLAMGCPVVPATCSPAGTITCGTPVSSRNDGAGSADLVDSWGGCGGRDASGPEIVYTLQAAAAGATTATLSGTPAGLDVYVLADLGSGCDPASCTAFDDTAATFNAVAGGTYYVVVDGFSGATGAFTLTITCPAATTCSSVGPIACGGSTAGDTAGAGSSSVINDYPGCFTPGMDGREQLHEFVAPSDDSVTVQLANAPAGLDVFVLRDDGAGCEAATCVTSGDTTAIFQAIAGQRYWIVADAPAGTSGSYGLGLSCAAAECDPAATLLCGDGVAHNNAWPVFTDVNDTYPCTPLDMSGPEYAFRFTATQSGQASATLSNLTGELDILILDGSLGCSAEACTAWGDTSVNFPIVGGHTYDVVVDGRAGAEGFFRLDLDCVVPPATCDPHAAIACGDLTGNDSAAGRDVVDSWPCAPGLDTSGPEYVFQFVPTEDATVRVVMDMNVEDLDLFVVADAGSGCDPSGCIATGDTEVTFDAVAGRVYYVVVDGQSGASDIFRLWMDCQRLPGRCRAGGPITCGQTLSGRNDASGSTDAIDQYPTCIPYPEDGPEYTYEFVATATGTLRATLSNLTADLDIFVLHDTGSGCGEPGCVAAGNMTVDVPVTAGERYFVVVEGFAGNVGGYDVTVQCL